MSSVKHHRTDAELAAAVQAAVLTLTRAAFKELFFLSFSHERQDALEIESPIPIPPKARGNKLSTHAAFPLFLRLAGFLGTAAGTKQILQTLLRVAMLHRNIEILRDRDELCIRFPQSRVPSEGYTHAVIAPHVDVYIQDSCRRAARYYCYQMRPGCQLQRDCKKNTGASSTGSSDKKANASCRVFALTRDQSANYFNWLAAHRATIDCHSRRVIFGDIHAPEFIYHGSLPGKPMKIISALKARTLLSHGCEGFLATIHDTTSDVSSIHDHRLFSELFMTYFPEEIPVRVKEQTFSKTGFSAPTLLVIMNFLFDHRYIDDILASPKSKEEHDRVSTMDPAKLRLSPNAKTDVVVRSTSFLSWIQVITSAILRGFSSRLAYPITKLMRKGVKFVGDEEREKSFEELKQRLVSSP
ncbi:hypothetical protein Tco_0877841 [Tanacetum coccineum]|uniref:Uncharacterized protein n=1 Tax=Tanacetum coccineum TaxID=301880 RepID=A0ABQ5BW72_9ASTR